MYTDKLETLQFYNNEVELVYDAKLHAYYVVEDGIKYLVPGATTVCGMIDKSGPLTGWAARSTVEWVRQELTTPWGDLDISPLTSIEALDSLLGRAKANYRNLTSAAADIGHMAHEWLEGRNISLINGVEYDAPLPENEKAVNCIKAALEWQAKHEFMPIEAERKVYSRELMTAGTFDWLAAMKGCGQSECCHFNYWVKALGDYKSSKMIYDEYRIQTAFYKKAQEEEFPNDPVDVRVILHLGKENGEFDSLTLDSKDDYERDLSAFEGALAIYTWTKQMALDKKYDKELFKAANALSKPKKPRKKLTVREVVEEDIPVVRM